MFEVFDHTADLGLRIRAPTWEGLLADAASGLFSVIAGDLDTVRPAETRTVQVAGTEHEFLLFDWLTELLYVFESQRFLVCQADVQLTAGGLVAVCHGESFDPDRHRLEHEVKAVTYHGLKVERLDSGWLAEVIVDI